MQATQEDVQEPTVARRPAPRVGALARLRASALRTALCGIALATAAGGRTSLAAPPTAAGPEVEVVVLAGAPVSGRLQAIDAAGVTIAGRAPTALAALREVRFPGAVAPTPPPTPTSAVDLRLTLVGGEEVRGRYVSGGAEAIEVRPTDEAVVRVPLDLLARVEAEAAFDAPCAEPSRDRPARPGSDVVYAANRDAFSGTLERLDAEGVTLDTGRGSPRTLAWKDFVVLHLDNPARPPAEGGAAEVETTSGSLWTAPSIAGDTTTVRFTSQSGLARELPIASVRVVRWWGAGYVFACDLPFTEERTPYYGDDVASWTAPWYAARVDRTRDGCPLRIHGVRYRKGLAVHSKSVVSVPLGKAFASFETRFGVDDEVLASGPEGPRGDVTARVLGDGKVLWASTGSVKGGEAARVVGPLDVRGVETLVLEVAFGGDLDRMDRADWADPVLVRAP